MIPLLELSRRRIRSAKKLVRVGRSERVVVIRVDKDNGTLPGFEHGARSRLFIRKLKQKIVEIQSRLEVLSEFIPLL